MHIKYLGIKFSDKVSSYNAILDKLNRFIRKYYSKMLVKGVLLFLAFGALFLFLVLGVEYVLWLSSSWRLVLLVVCVGVALFLLFRYILTPLFYLFKLKRGICNKEASILIGRHFLEVDDKLLNLLDLAEDKDQSELLLASIEQRSGSLNAIPFTKAVNFRENLRYLKYLAVPVIIFGLIWLSGNLSSFFSSANRVVNYDLAYEPPAPFVFKLLSNNLDVLETEAFSVQVITEGEVKPENIAIVVNGKEFLLQQRDGLYQYSFTPPLKSADFYFIANGIKSRMYTLNALKTPLISNFNLVLDYPNYTNKPSESIKSTGNAIFPEGTRVTWIIQGKNTEDIKLVLRDTTVAFTKQDDSFVYVKKVYSNLQYQVSTSNENVTDYEKLNYQFTVIKDAYPTIKVRQVIDSLNPNVSYYTGEASDDYELTNIRLICYPNNEPDKKQSIPIANPNVNYQQFYYTYPSGLDLQENIPYSFYFEAIDNDAIHKGKSVKSEIFSLALLNTNQLKNKDLESQQSIIKNLNRSLENFKEQKKSLKEINKEQKEKSQLNFNDKNQIKDFLQKQEQQEELMQKFSKQLKENLSKSDKKDKLNKLLQERLERQELEAKKNQKLIEELNKVAEKINKEELAKRLENLGKKQQNSERGLEQLLELTKRYYVTEKADQLARDLEKLAERQEILSKIDIGDKQTNDEQEKLNEQFKNLEKEFDELKKDNQDLKKPIDLEFDKVKAGDVKQDQRDALEEIKKHQGTDESSDSPSKQKNANKAKQKQQSAAQKMKEMSEKLQQSASGGGGSSVTEDAQMLRQILDNLITFSFKQEKLYESLENIETNETQFSNNVKKQKELRGLFEHVDDSLFALSLRQAELSEFVNEQITEVYYNLDKSLESLAENQIYQGVSYQKYVLNASNSLADFLAKLLDNMNESMKPGKGQGEGEGFQLPDIIQGQGELKEKMEGMGKSGQGKPKNGEGEGKSGQGKQKGEGTQGDKEGKGKVENGKVKGDGMGEGGDNGNKGRGKGGGNGDNGSEGNQGQPSERELKELYEIYKEQQQIRQQLEKQLLDMINQSDRKLGKKLVRQMEDFENDLLENGVTQRSLNKISTIQYEMLKLENAAMKQGKKSERESNTSKDKYQNPVLTRPSLLDNYQNEIEILNRQALPLQQIFQNKVKNYFKRND